MWDQNLNCRKIFVRTLISFVKDFRLNHYVICWALLFYLKHLDICQGIGKDLCNQNRAQIKTDFLQPLFSNICAIDIVIVWCYINCNVQRALCVFCLWCCNRNTMRTRPGVSGWVLMFLSLGCDYIVPANSDNKQVLLLRHVPLYLNLCSTNFHFGTNKWTITIKLLLFKCSSSSVLKGR